MHALHRTFKKYVYKIPCLVEQFLLDSPLLPARIVMCQMAATLVRQNTASVLMAPLLIFLGMYLFIFQVLFHCWSGKFLPDLDL